MSLHIENMFEQAGKDAMVARINALTPTTEAQWGKMDVGQMLAHCNVAYEIAHEPGMHTPPGFIGKFFANLFAKGVVFGEDKPYPKNGQTAPMFKVEEAKDFATEKARIIAYIEKTFEEGTARFEGLENMTFGKLSSRQWNTMFSKHLDHHLKQFGV